MSIWYVSSPKDHKVIIFRYDYAYQSANSGLNWDNYVRSFKVSSHDPYDQYRNN